MTFTRWKSHFRTSRAFQQFKAHHTELNELYWSLPPVAGYADYLARHSALPVTTAALFKATGPDVRRLAPDAAKWRRDFNEFQNWVRLSTLVSALSYLETYISAVITLALRSDPLQRYGQSRTVDGVVWLKANAKYSVRDYVVPCVMGTWNKRLSAYRKLFGRVPANVMGHLSALERMRILRNGVAHSFGRSPDQFGDPLGQSNSVFRLSQTRLQTWLGVIEEVAAAIDVHLFNDHLGEFELLWQYHRWQAKRGKTRAAITEHAAFAKELGRLYGRGPSREYCKALIAYYRRA